jgi:hypothetical protein
MPPSAITVTPARAASKRKRTAPSVAAPGCERVANTGESRIASAPALRALPISRSEWAVQIVHLHPRPSAGRRAGRSG